MPLEFLLHQLIIVVNIGEVCSTSSMGYGVDGEKKFLQHFNVGMPLEENQSGRY